MIWTPEGRALLFIFRGAIYRVEIGGAEPERLPGQPGGASHLAFSPGGRYLSFLQAGDLWLWDQKSNNACKPPRWESLPSAPCREAVTSVPTSSSEPISGMRVNRHTSGHRTRVMSLCKSRIDDYTLHGRLVLPPSLAPGKKYPVIVGPVYSNSARNRWAGSRGTLQQYLALEGSYIGLQVDIRGSTGYGRSFREAFHSDTGGGDIKDLASAVAFLKTLPYVDPDRIGIWGSSYGGTLTVFSLFKKPGLFRAGVAAAPAVDAQFFGTDDIALMGLPRTDPDVYRRVSAIHLGEDLEDPLLILHGMQDAIVPFKTSLVLAEKLMLLGKNFDFVFTPAATHAWTRKEHEAIFLTRKLVEHFDRHLGRGPSAAKSENP